MTGKELVSDRAVAVSSCVDADERLPNILLRWCRVGSAKVGRNLHYSLLHASGSGSIVSYAIAFRKCDFELRNARAVRNVWFWGAACHFHYFGAEVADESNPTLRKRELGVLLRELRLERGLSIEDVTRQAMFSPTKLSRLETGRVGASPRDIRDLCIVYGVTDTAQRQRLMDLAREGKQRAWWQTYDLPYATYVALETEAASISNYDTNVVPGLLQVEGYMRAIFEVSEPPYSPEAIERQIEARIRRQALLTRDDVPLLHFIVDEASLSRPVGGPSVMAEQLARIIDVTDKPEVTFQVIPLNVGAHPGLDSNFVILEFAKPPGSNDVKPMVNNVVYVEGPVGNIYLESDGDLERYKRIFSRLQAMALSPEDSISLAARIAASYKKDRGSSRRAGKPT